MELNAAKEDRLALTEVKENEVVQEIPVQLIDYDEDEYSELILIMPNGEPGTRKIKLNNKKKLHSLDLYRLVKVTKMIK